ncbi:hypothetical protein Bca4012_005724 [Brassica carinata]
MISPCIRHEICGVLVLLAVLTSGFKPRYVMFRLTKETRSTIVLRCQVRDRATLRHEGYGEDKLCSHQ